MPSSAGRFLTSGTGRCLGRHAPASTNSQGWRDREHPSRNRQACGASSRSATRSRSNGSERWRAVHGPVAAARERTEVVNLGVASTTDQELRSWKLKRSVTTLTSSCSPPASRTIGGPHLRTFASLPKPTYVLAGDVLQLRKPGERGTSPSGPAVTWLKRCFRNSGTRPAASDVSASGGGSVDLLFDTIVGRWRRRTRASRVARGSAGLRA